MIFTPLTPKPAIVTVWDTVSLFCTSTRETRSLQRSVRIAADSAVTFRAFTSMPVSSPIS